MLSKDVCKKCSERWPKIWLKESSIVVRDSWDDDDDVKWERGIVLCPNIDVKDNEAIVSGDPPEWCEYKFEQAVAAGTKNAQ